MCARRGQRAPCRNVPLIAAVAVLVFFEIGATRSYAQSEGAIRGQLVAQADGMPLPQGSVTLRSQSAGPVIQAVVDSAGRFAFPNVSPGDYLLAASSDGFSTRNLRLSLAPRETRSVTVPLALAAVSVTIDVPAEAPQLPRTHSPSSTVLTAARLERVPVAERSGLPDAIVTAAPGMIRGHDDFVHVRGEEVALNPLINGVSFWENVHAVFSAGLSPEVIDTANVMTGGFPAEYGNRFGGVVDIVTRSGLRMDTSGSLAVNGGEAGRRNVFGDFGGHRDRVGYYVFGSLFESDRFLSPPDPEAIHDHAQGAHGFLQLDADLGRRGLLRAIVMADGADFEIPKTPEDLAWRPSANANQRTRQQTAIVAWNRAWSGSTMGVTFYERWSRSALLPASGPLTARASQTRELVTIGGKADLTRFVGAHTIKAGFDAVRLRPDENLQYDYAGFRELAHLLQLPHLRIAENAVDFTGRESGSQVSGYVQDDIRLGRRVTADLGLRLDRYALAVDATHASPRMNLAFEAGGGTVIHTSYNHFFVPPPIEGVLSSAAGLTGRIEDIGVALPPVKPTIENQFELGVSSPAGPVQLGLTGYYRASDNPVHTTVWPDARIYSYASFDRARAYGLEAKAEMSRVGRDGLSGYCNYALGRVYFYNPVTGGFVTEAEHLENTDRFLAPMDQTHTLTGGLTYRPAASGPWIGTMLEYGSGTPMERGESPDVPTAGETGHTHAHSAETARVPGHFTANLSLGLDLLRRAHRLPRLSLRIDVENIADNLYLVAQESEFTRGQYSIPRLISATAQVRF